MFFKKKRFIFAVLMNFKLDIMNNGEKKEHESFGMIEISRYSGNNQQFFGSDLYQNGGITLRISNAQVETKYNSEWYHHTAPLIEVRMSHNQFVDAITSGMNTNGVPCTIQRVGLQRVPQIDHVADKKEEFQNSMKVTQKEYINKINDLISKLDGNIGKKKANEIKNDLDTLKRHIASNTNFVMDCFNEGMEKTVTDAKHSISNYIDHKVHSLGIEGIRNELKISIENE